jgi:hypothetical protein
MKICKSLLLVVVGLFVLVPQYSGRPAVEKGTFKDLTLTLATPKKSYLELQPIPLVITLKNETNEPLEGHGVLGFGTGYLHLYVDRGNGPEEISQLTLLKRGVYADPREFKPGEEISVTERLNLKLNEVFPRPGTYRLQARLIAIGGKETVSSKPIKVEIIAPDGLDAHALQYIREHDDPAYFFTGLKAVKDPEKLEVLENFNAIYSQSGYADDATFLMGQVQFARRDYQKARVLFEKLSRKSDFGFVGEVTKFLKMIEREEKKKDRP